MKEYTSEVNGLYNKSNRETFITVVGLYKYSKYDIKIYESVKGTVDAMVNIFLNCDDERIKDTVCKTFSKYTGIFYAKWSSDGEHNYEYKGRIDAERIPKNLCKEIINISKWIEKEIENDKKLSKKREIKANKLEINLRKKANLSIFDQIRKGLNRGR